MIKKSALHIYKITNGPYEVLRYHFADRWATEYLASCTSLEAAYAAYRLLNIDT